MAIVLRQEVIDIVSSAETVKILATVDEKKVPYAEEISFAEIRPDGKIQFLELLETARSYKNFTRSLWFGEPITITLIGSDKTSYRIVGIPEQIKVCGDEFEENYRKVRKELGDVDLAAVCIIDPISAEEITLRKKVKEQDEAHPVFKHLDRIAK